MSQKITTFEVLALFNTAIEKIERKDDGNYFVKLKSANGKKMFRAGMMFLNEKDAEEYQAEFNNDVNKFANKLRDATVI